MTGARLACVALAGVLLEASLAPGGVVKVDGNIMAPDRYDAFLGDPEEGVFESPSWDVRGVYFDLDKSNFYVGIETVGQFDRNGGDTSTEGRTEVFMEFRDTLTPTVQTLELILTDTTEELLIDGVLVVSKPFMRWMVKTGTDLELAVSNELIGMRWLPPGTDITLRLDDTGVGEHDEVVGRVPEPSALALAGLGALALLKGRRRK